MGSGQRRVQSTERSAERSAERSVEWECEVQSLESPIWTVEYGVRVRNLEYRGQSVRYKVWSAKCRIKLHGMG